jgi:hypothetical protein
MIRSRYAALALVALAGAGCSNAPAEKSTATSKAMKFAQCMRDNGVSEFPDPDASGELTIDAVANGSSLDTDTAAFKNAVSACRDLEPAGFIGHKRSAQKQQSALEFAQCMRDNGVRDFPDPTPDSPLIDTTRIPSAAGRGARSIPGFVAATQKCSAAFSGELGLENR